LSSLFLEDGIVNRVRGKIKTLLPHLLPQQAGEKKPPVVRGTTGGRGGS
jgi:hypothetical protein